MQVAALLPAEGCLPAGGWQVALTVELSTGYLVGQLFQPRLTDERLEQLPGEGLRMLSAGRTIIELHNERR